MKFSGNRHLIVPHVWLKNKSIAAITTGRKVHWPELPVARINPLPPKSLC